MNVCVQVAEDVVRGNWRARDAKDGCSVRMADALLVVECRCGSLYLKRYRSMQGSVQHFCLFVHDRIGVFGGDDKQIRRDAHPMC